ncbi:putative quinol monooxygenase [Auraticoccus monumenti]|uniref:Quinol monooxygenase YgiN n=1 Tax=Auraticoccus monumenti TaxID=675864 RepID=A0A1G6UYX1_9ACTN|nr:putative quinol monooxygenase [Auraticoccus monumenti]SDD46529.1 Quinol monooxygenase YgiN [Auraticoccus monumenti]
MYLIVVKFQTKPEWTDRWLGLVEDFTRATRAEPGNLWFEWSRSVEDPHEFVLVEAFTDDGAAPHVQSEHFRDAMALLPQALAATPRIVSRQVEGEGWEEMGEMRVDPTPTGS